MTRILIANHHEVIRCGLRAILESREGWQIVAEAGNGKDAVASAVETRPDIAIINYSLPMLNGIEVTRQIRSRSPGTSILIYTTLDSDVLVGDLLEAGARGYLLRSDPKQHLIAAVEALINNKPFFTGRISEMLLDSFLSIHHGKGAVALSLRERMIVKLVAEGYSNKEMSVALKLSIKTIETHRASAMHKLNLGSTAALVRYAVRNRIIEP